MQRLLHINISEIKISYLPQNLSLTFNKHCLFTFCLSTCEPIRILYYIAYRLPSTIHTMNDIVNTCGMADPLYAIHRDIANIRGDIALKLCVAMDLVTPDDVVGAQKCRGVWLIYVKNDNSRQILLQQPNMCIDKLTFQIYGSNPFTTQNNTEEKIIFKDIPLWESNTMLEVYLKTQGHIVPTSNIYNTIIRDENGKSTKFLRGDRYIFAKANFPPLSQNKFKLKTILFVFGTVLKQRSVLGVEQREIIILVKHKSVTHTSQITIIK